ncbi:MAG: hypothetical protein KAT65_00845 [Methanophagales archaeon]|nr:hypothetical protein [Methanophagales archaeon]
MKTPPGFKASNIFVRNESRSSFSKLSVADASIRSFAARLSKNSLVFSGWLPIASATVSAETSSRNTRRE